MFSQGIKMQTRLLLAHGLCLDHLQIPRAQHSAWPTVSAVHLPIQSSGEVSKDFLSEMTLISCFSQSPLCDMLVIYLLCLQHKAHKYLENYLSFLVALLRLSLLTLEMVNPRLQSFTTNVHVWNRLKPFRNRLLCRK